MKQRLIGAAVLVALAVIFLPMLIKGPAPESGASDVPLELPPAPQGGFETRELPLVAPPAAPEDGALGMPRAPAGLPTDATAATGTDAPAGDVTQDGAEGADGADPAASGGPAMTPPPTAGGDYAVSFGSYATQADAARVVGALRASQLPGYQEAVDEDGRTLFRVRIGPYASRATAETARLRAAHVRDDVGARVVNIAVAADDAAAETPERSAAAEPPADDEAPAAQARTAGPAENRPAPEPARPAAAANVGFAVQVGAFGVEANATRLRDRARELGFSAFVVSEPSSQGALNVVKVGPVADRAEAERLKAQVAARMGIAGTIGSHP